MPIIPLHFTRKTLDALPPPANGKQQEYKDVTHPQLRIMRYPSSLSFLFKTTHRYQPICETLGTYPYMSIQDARSAVYERMQALQSGTYSLGKNKRLDEVYQTLYLTDLKLNKRNTASELYKVKKYILPRFGDSKIGKIERQDIESFKLDLCAHLQPSSVNKILAALSRMFTLSVEHGYLASSPMNGVKRLKENNQRHRVLTTDERQGFITACHALQTPGANSLLLSLYTGMRIGEVLSIKNSNVHLDASYLVLPLTKNGQQHVVPLSTSAIATIREQQAAFGIKDYLFFSPNRANAPLAYPRHAFGQICKHAGIQGLCIHDLRRSFATTLLQETGDLALAAQTLNHNSLETTRLYARYQVNELIEKINATQASWSSVHDR